MRRAFILLAVVATISLSFGSAANAAVCASNLGPGSSFGGPVFAVTGQGFSTQFDRAFRFTPSVDCRLGTIEVAFHLESGPNGLRISVVEDASGQPGSTVVESTTVIGEMTTDLAGSLVTGLFTGANLLSGSSTYWIVVEAEPLTGDTFAIWHTLAVVIQDVMAVRTNGGSWMVSVASPGAFRVSEPVPVPAMSLWGHGVLAAALALSAALAARRRPIPAKPVGISIIGVWRLRATT